MLVPVLLALLALLVVVVALLRDEADVLPAPPTAPRFDGLPTPADLQRVELPTATAGYDPASVEATLDAFRNAYADLYAAATPAVRRRAARRAAARSGRHGPAEPARAVMTSGWAGEEGSPDGNGPAQLTLEEALRAEAALASLAAQPDHGVLADDLDGDLERDAAPAERRG